MIPATVDGDRITEAGRLLAAESARYAARGWMRDADDLVTVPVVANSPDMGVLGDAFQDRWRPDVPALIVARHGVYVWGTTSARPHSTWRAWTGC